MITRFHVFKVRWFYKREADKEWTPFMGYDSLRIELRYRHIWQTKWAAAANNSEDPAAAAAATPAGNGTPAAAGVLLTRIRYRKFVNLCLIHFSNEFRMFGNQILRLGQTPECSKIM